MTTAGRDPREPLAAVLVQLRARVDAHFDQALARTPAAFQCAAGCDACCHVRIGVFAVEADPIRRALAGLATRDPALRRRVRDQADDPTHQDRCALLVDGRCAVYAERPLICRSHGLPIAVPDPTDASGKLRLDHCPLNFQNQSPPRESILRLDAVNQPCWRRSGRKPSRRTDLPISSPASPSPTSLAPPIRRIPPITDQ